MKITKTDLRSLAFAIEILFSVEKKSMSPAYRLESAKHRIALQKVMILVSDAICQNTFSFHEKLRQDIDGHSDTLKGIEALQAANH